MVTTTQVHDLRVEDLWAGECRISTKNHIQRRVDAGWSPYQSAYATRPMKRKFDATLFHRQATYEREKQQGLYLDNNRKFQKAANRNN